MAKVEYTGEMKLERVDPAPLLEAARAAAVDEAERYRLELEVEIGGKLEAPRGELSAEARANLDRMLFKMRELIQEIQDLETTARLRYEDIELWLHRETRRQRAQLTYLTMVLEDAAANVVFPTGKKSINLPSGTLGRRALQPTLTVVDKDAALAFSRKHGILIKEEPYAGELKKWAAQRKFKKVPDGCTVQVGRDDKPYVEVAK